MAKNRLIKSSRGNGYGILDEETNMVTPVSFDTNKLIESKKGNGFGLQFGDTVVPVDISGLGKSDISLFQKKNPNQADTELSGANASTDTNQEEDSWYEKLYNGAIGMGKSAYNAIPEITKGLTRLASTGYSSGVGAPSMNILAETRGEKVKYKTNDELLQGAETVAEQYGTPFQKSSLPKGKSSVSELIKQGYISSDDAQNIGYQLGDGIVQMAVGAVPGLGGTLLFAKNFEQRYEDTRAKGIPIARAYQESGLGAFIETSIEKSVGVDKWIAAGMGKKVAKEAITDISAALLSREAFEATAKKYAKSLSIDNIVQGFKKGFLPEAIEEAAQTYVDATEQDLFDIYERKRKENNPNTKLELYDPNDEEGLLKSKTFFGALDAAFYGGLTGQMGGMFVDSRSFNPSIYSTLQNAYDSQGKEGLVKSVETVKQGLTKASEDGKLDVNSYNNALKNVDKIAENVSKFEQNSDINSYSRYLLYDNSERIIPQESSKIARNLAEIMTPMEMPNEDQINDDINNKDVVPVSFEQAKDVPVPYKEFVTVSENEKGERVIQGEVPNSVVKAYTDNQLAIQEAMNNPLFAVQSLTDNNKLVSIEDLERIGQQGGDFNNDLSQQLNFKAKFEANKKSFNKGLRVINYAKEISKGILDGNVADAEKLRRGYANIFAFNEGDTVFYGNKSAKVLEISPNGQSLKLSGIQERVDASDEMLALEDSVKEEMIPVTPATLEEDTPAQEVSTEEIKPLAEEEKITGRTMREAVDELIPFTYRGETGEMYKQRNGVVVFESPNRVYEFGNINDIGDRSIDEFDIIPQEMEIGDDFSVTIDGKKFTNKSQNPFKAITYDADGNAVSIKLDNEKGQTRVIKGTRAILIDAKYKVKQLFNESTRDQLAAAADDAARQAETASETTGEPGQTTATTEGKPTEQAPSIAQQERAARIREVAKKLAEQESEQTTQNRKAVANLAASLYTAGINVEVLDSGAIRTKYGKNASQGMFLSQNGTIVINESVLPTEWGKTVIFHEGTHPIINIIRNVEPKLYKQLVSAAKEEAKTNPEVNKILQQIRESKAYGDEFTRNDELVVEIIARVASGKLNLNDVKPSFKQSIIDFINKIAKTLGLNPVLSNTDQVALSRLATQISDTLNAGRDIAEIVGAKNVINYKSDISSLQSRTLEPEKLSPVVVSKNGHKLSFVKEEDLIDIVSLVNEIAAKNQKVWFWVADQLGRGFYFDEYLNKEHYLDAGISYALDPENLEKGAIWASGLDKSALESSIADSDYIFIISGSAIKSKMFNKKVFSILQERNPDYNKFKSEVLATNPVALIKKILQENNSWDDVITSQVVIGNKNGKDIKAPSRKQLLIEIEAQRDKGTPLNALLKKTNSFIDYNSIRDGFLVDNNFNLNDIMLVLKPTGVGGKSSHSTYENDILGKVIGVPDKKINAFDILPDDRRGNNPESLPESQRTAKIAPYGSGIRSLEGIQMSDINRETLVAPNGKPSKLNSNQHRQVRTPEFKAWFGDWENDPENASKVIDENGEPMVVYTGTSKDKDFDKFNVPTNGAWFTSDPSIASDYAVDNDSQKTKMEVVGGDYKFTDVNTTPRVIPAFLNIRNLIDFKTTELVTDKQRESLKYADNYKKEQKILFQNIFFSKSQAERIAGNYNDGIKYADGIYVILLDSNQVKSAIGNNGKFSPTNPKIQMSDIDRTYSPETTVSDAGMTMAERENWKEKNKVSQRQKRTPIVMQASRDLYNGEITFDDYVAVVRENMPIKPFLNVPKIPSVKEIISALDNGKLSKGGVVGVNRSFADGERVASRLDIDAYEQYDTWVVSIHDSAKERILGYGQTAVLKNVQFKTSPKIGLSIAANATFLNDMDKKSKGKETIARIHGDWVNESPESAHKRATELMEDPSWTQVGMNPFRHSFFYDKATGEALTSADEVIQIGALVLAKNAVKAPFGSQAFVDNFSMKNKLGEVMQFSDINRDDKRIQFIRENINNYSKSELTEGLMQAFDMSREAAERIVAQATANPLAPSIPQDNPDMSIPKGAKLNEKSETTEKYNSGYDKAKKALLEKAGVSWQSVKKGLIEQYDSKFYGRRNLGMASTEKSLAQARLRNLNGIAYSAGQELGVIYNDIFGNGLEAEGERTLNAMIFNLRLLQIDANTEAKYQDEIERLSLDFMDSNGRMPSASEAVSIKREARLNVPIKKHGKTLDGSVDATSATAQAYLDALRLELGESEYNMLAGRAEMFRKVGNEEVAKLQAAGIISKEVADGFKDDFYAYRKTLDRLYGEQDLTVTMLNGVATIKGWASLSKEGTENFLEQDARLLLAESYIGTARAIAKNKLRESIYDENIKIDEDGNESSIIDKEGNKITFIKPAVYIRDKDGNIRSNNKQLSVRDADEGYVNVPYKKDGVVRFFQMERNMFDQIEGNNIVWNDAKSNNIIANVYYWTSDVINRILTGFATRKNPVFWIGNVPMDLQQQVFFTDIWTDGNAIESNVYSAGARALARTIKFARPFGRNKELVDATLAEYVAAGGAMDRMSTMKEQRQRTIKIALNEVETTSNYKKAKKALGNFFFGLNDRTEVAMRLAAYDQSKNNLINKYKEDNNGKAPSESDMLKIQEIAASQARGYTDFAQRGTVLPNLNFAYLNSGIQGAGSALEYSLDNKAKVASKISQAVLGKFAGTVAIMALMGDAYDDLDEYTKDLYSFLYAFDTKLKDGNGKPVMVTANVRNNPSLVPVLGITRSFAEMTMRHIQGKEQNEVTAQGSAERFLSLINAGSPIPAPGSLSAEGLKDWSLKLITKGTLFNAGTKMLTGYDAFKSKNIVSVADENLSPYMQGMNDKNVAYFYKVIAKSMANNSTSNQISPAKMQSVVETFITSPSTNIFTAALYSTLSTVANAIVPAQSEAEMGQYSLTDYTKLVQSLTKRFASYTDSEKTEFRKNEELYKQSREEAYKYNDFEKTIDVKLKELYKADSNNFFDNVDKFAKEKGYWDNDMVMERLDRKAQLMDKNEYNRSFINENIANEVKILHFTPGAEGKAKLLKYMFDKDATKARQVIDGMIDYGTSTKEAYDAEDLYLKGIK